jgi:hypothetical protein
MKSFARYFLFGLVATSVPAVACVLVVEIAFGVPRQIPGAIAIICAQIGYFYIRFVRGRRRGKSESLVAADAATAARTPIYWKIIGCIAGGICITVLFIAAVSHILEISPNAGQFDRVKMEGLVAQVRNQKFGGERQFYWSDVSGTVAFSTGTVTGQHNLWAERAEDQNLKVIIWTKDGGHTSFAYGFAYSDVPLALDGTRPDTLIFFSSGPDSTVAHPATPAFNVPGLHLVKRIDVHWWEVYDDSRK